MLTNFNAFLKVFTGSVPQIRGFSKTIMIDDKKVNISVLNSCLSNTLGEDQYPPFIDIEELKTNASNKEDYDLSILAMHHPTNDFYVDNKHQIEELIPKSFDIVIAGDEHLPDYRIINFSDDEEVAYVTNGCAFQKDEQNIERHPYRFSIIEFQPSNGTITIHCWMTTRLMHFCAKDTTVQSKVEKPELSI